MTKMFDAFTKTSNLPISIFNGPEEKIHVKDLTVQNQSNLQLQLGAEKSKQNNYKLKFTTDNLENTLYNNSLNMNIQAPNPKSILNLTKQLDNLIQTQTSKNNLPEKLLQSSNNIKQQIINEKNSTQSNFSKHLTQTNEYNKQNSITINSNIEPHIHHSVEKILDHHKQTEQELILTTQNLLQQNKYNQFCQENINVVKKDNNQLKQQLNMQISENQNQQDVISQQQAKLDDQKLLIESLIQQLQQLQNSQPLPKLELLTQINQLNQQLNDKTETISQQNTQIYQLNDELLQLKEENQLLNLDNKRVIQLQQERDEQKQTIISMTTQMSKISKENNDLKLELENQVEENVYILQNMFQNYDIIQLKLSDIKLQIQEQDYKISMLQQQFQTLSQQLLQLAQQCFQNDVYHAEVIDQLKSVIQKYEQQIKDISRQLLFDQKQQVLNKDLLLNLQIQLKSQIISTKELEQHHFNVLKEYQNNVNKLNQINLSVDQEKNDVIQRQQKLILDLSRQFSNFTETIQIKLRQVEVEDQFNENALNSVLDQYKQIMSYIGLQNILLMGANSQQLSGAQKQRYQKMQQLAVMQ